MLVNYCLFTAKSSHPFSVTHIKAFAWAIVCKNARKSRLNETSDPSWKWWRWFHKRHPEIMLPKPEKLDLGRSRTNNENAMKNFFTLHNNLLNATGLIYKLFHIFNADESGVDLNSKAEKVVVATKSKHAYTEQKSFRDHITTLACCSASGLMLYQW